MKYDVLHWIEGHEEKSEGRVLDIYNPATGETIAGVTVANAAVVDRAVKAAEKAFVSWSQTTPLQRSKIMFKFKQLLDKNVNELAAIVSREHGKTLSEAVGSVQRGIDVVDFVCGIPQHLKGAFMESVAVGMDSYSLHQPLGVCAGITPFNFPAMIALWMFPMAIACGNTFILKPSEKDPSCSLKLVALAKEAGVPDGVVNVIQGDKETVDAILNHPTIKAVSFVGSSAVAEYVHHTATARNKRVQAFGGAKNHCVVMPDADLDQAAESIVASAYNCAGQRCMAISAVVCVGDKTADALIAKMKPMIEGLRVGPGHLEKIDMGPLVTKQHYEKVSHYIEAGKKEGATLVIDGSHYRSPDQPNGFFMAGSLFDRVTPSMSIYRDEIFGPVLIVVRVPDFASALQLVNEHEYGNGTSIFTRDGYYARLFSEKVQVGMVGVNVAVPVPVAYHSFGGWKRSIFADIGMYGAEAVRFYTRLKTVTQRWNEGEKI